MTSKKFAFKERSHFFPRGSSTPLPCHCPTCPRRACRTYTLKWNVRAVAQAVRNREFMQFVTITKLDPATVDTVAPLVVALARKSRSDVEAAWTVEPHKEGLVHIHMILSYGVQGDSSFVLDDVAVLETLVRSRLRSDWTSIDVEVRNAQMSAYGTSAYIMKNAEGTLLKHLSLNAGSLVRTTRSFFTNVGGKEAAASSEGRMARLFILAARKYGAEAASVWFQNVRNYEQARREYALALKTNPPFVKFTSERFDFPKEVREFFAAFGLDWSDVCVT